MTDSDPLRETSLFDLMIHDRHGLTVVPTASHRRHDLGGER